MGRASSHEPRLLRVWLVSCAISVAVAVAGKLIEHWSSCDYLPGNGDCVLRLLYVKLYCYAAGFVILVGMTTYVVITARRRARRGPR